MRIKCPEYKEWKKYQNLKNLKKRTKKRKRKKTRLRKSKKIYQRIIAPATLSLVNNPEETLQYFNNAIQILKNPFNKNKVNALMFDCKSVKTLTIDSLMYLLAIIRNFKDVFSGIREIKGNLPDDPTARKIFIDSGFLDYVNTTIKTDIETEKRNKLKISTGSNVNVEEASNLIEFVKNYFKCSNVETKFLYKMIIELMTNTHNHAYNSKHSFIKAWYLFAAVNHNKDCIEITFVDTGDGIPVTVAKKTIEKIFTKKDNEYIISALNGDFRTQTHEKNRGKGLPDIYEHFCSGQISNLKIISCKGKIELNEYNKVVENAGTELENNLRGTIFYWEVKIRKESDKSDN